MVWWTVILIACIVASWVTLRHILSWRASKKYEKNYLRGVCVFGDELLLSPNGYPFIIQQRKWDKFSRKN